MKFRRGNSTRISQITRYYDIFTNIEMYATYKIVMYIGDVFNSFKTYLMMMMIIISYYLLLLLMFTRFGVKLSIIFCR